MENHKKIISAAAILLLVLNAGCVILRTKTTESGMHNQSMEPPLEFTGSETKKLWDGEIDGRRVMQFTSIRDDKCHDGIVVIQDNLSHYFKRIEYIDRDCDGTLDLVRMKIYEKDKGWRNVGISEENKYGLKYAETIYKEMLTKIAEFRNSKK